MSISLTDHLSAITTDAAGVTHVVWVEDAAIWHAVYDDNAATWIEAQVIAEVGQQKVTGLNLLASETLITGNEQPAPGLAVVYQQGSENESNFFYTAAQYNASGGLQWLNRPQALTADAVADLEPRAITYNNQGTTEVVVVGQKVNTDQASNQGVREDTDLYYQSFSVSSSQFSNPSNSGNGASSSLINQAAKPSSLYVNQRINSPKASYSVLTVSEAKTKIAANWNGNTSQNFSLSLFQAFLAFFKPNQQNQQNQQNNQEEGPKKTKALFNNLGFNLSGTLQTSLLKSNPEWSLFGGPNNLPSTAGDLLLNAVATLGLNTTGDAKSRLSKKGRSDDDGPLQKDLGLSVTLATLYTFNQPDSAGKFPLALETGSLGVTVTFTYPLVAPTSGPLGKIGFTANLFGNAGISFQWQAAPNDKNPSYEPPLIPVFSSTGDLTTAFLATSIPDPLALGVAVIADIADSIALAIDSKKLDDPLEVESLLLGIPITAGVDTTISIPYLLKLAGSLGVFLDFTINLQDKDGDTFTLGFPFNLTISTLGGLFSTRWAGFPTFTWNLTPNPESASFVLPAISTASSPTASVDGTLLTINFTTDLASNLNLTPSDFTVTVKDAKGNQSTIPVFDVVIQGNTIILRLEQAIPYATLNDQPLSDSIPNPITVTYSGNQLNDFTHVTVTNNSSQNITYTYDPTRGTQSLYENNAQQIAINFNTPLNPQSIPDPDFFTITTTNNTTLQLSPASSAIQINAKSLVLTLASSLPAGEIYTVTYNPSGTEDILTTANNQPISAFSISSANPPTAAGSVNSTFGSSATINKIAANTNNDLAQDGPPALALTNSGQVLIAWSSDAPYLLPLSAIASDDSIYLSFSADLGNSQTQENLPSLDQFSISINGKSIAVTGLAITNNTVTLSLATTVTSIDQVTVSYSLVNNNPSTNLYFTDPTQTQFWIQPFANLVASQASDNLVNPSLLDLTLGNNSYQAYGLGQTLVVPFDRLLSAQKSNISGQDFTVMINNQTASITDVTVSDLSVVLSIGAFTNRSVGKALIGQGDAVSIAYNPVTGHSLVDKNAQTVDAFTINKFEVLTTPANSSSVIKTTFYPFGENDVSPLTTIPGVAGLNSDPALITHGPTQTNVAVWVNVDTRNVPLQLIPGQNYTSEQAQTINNALANSDIYYSVLGPGNQWTVAAPIASLQPGQDQKVALGSLPNGDLIAAWLNTQSDNSTGETTTTIYWSSWNGSQWTTPQALLAETSPDAFSELRITDVEGQPAIFWTESQPASYSTLIENDNPQVYLRLGELTGPTAVNSGEFATIEGQYSGSFQLNQPGALEQSGNTGDPNPAVLFEGGGLTLNGAIPLSSQGFSVEFWFKLPRLNAIPNVVSMADIFLFTVNDTQLRFSLNNTDSSTIITTQPLDINTWYYVVGTYDASQDSLALYLNSELVESLDNISFSNFPQISSGTLSIVGNGGSIYIDEVAFYNQILTASESSNSGLTAADAMNLNGNDLVDGTLGVDQIGNHYQARYVDPVPPGPEVHYSLWDSTSSTWQAPSQIDPIPQVVPTILADANYPVWDIVAVTNSPGGTTIFPNGLADSIFQITLTGYQGQEITGIAVTVSSNTNLLWGVGQKGDGTAIGGYQVGVILGETMGNSSQLAFTDGATLLNSRNASLSGLNHQIRGETETLNLFIDTTGNTFSGTPTITVYVKDNKGVASSVTPPPFVLALPNQGGPVAANSTDYLDTQVLGIATVTEANDASLANIDSGFVINTNNTAIGAVATSAFNSDGSLAYVALGNRGYTDNQGTLVNNGTVQILFAGGNALKGTETNILTTTDLLGNPDGILITGLADAGTAKNNLALSLVTGYIAGNPTNIPDLVIGDANANNGNGAIYVIYGSYLSTNKGKIIDVASLTTTPSDMGFVFNGLDTEGAAGYAVTVGNFDNDTYADVAFGAPQAKNSDGIVVGKVYLIKGFSPSSPPNPITANTVYSGQTQPISSKQADGSSQTVTVGEAAGYTLAASSYVGGATTFAGNDHYDDLIIGAPGYPISVNNQWQGQQGLPSDSQGLFPDATPITAGAVYVLAGSANGLSASPTLSYAGPNVPAANGVAANYLAGSALASEDIDSDGQKDLAISALGVNANAGAVYVLKGGSATQNPNRQFLNTVSNLTINGGIPSSKAGSVVSFPGDINGDGHQDFLITAPQASNGTGQSYLLFGPLTLDGTGNLFDLSVTGSDKAFLLNGSLPYQIAGTAAVGVGDLNGDNVDDLMITAPNAQQAYAVYGQTYLKDDGSIKLADVSSDNGFVIDGNAFSTFKVVNSAIPNQGTNETTALVSYQGTLYMAIKGEGTNQGIFWTTSQDNGKTWSPAVPIFADGATNVSPSLAVDEQGTLYLAYLGLDPLLNIMYSTDGGQNWSPQYQIPGQTSTNSPTLVFYQNHLFTFFTAQDSSSRILYVYSDNPQSSDSWSTAYPVTYNNGTDNQTSPTAVSATVLDNTLYLAYQTGTQSSPSQGVDVTYTTGTDLSNLSWSLTSVPGLSTEQTPSLTSDSQALYLLNTTNVVDADQTLFLSTSTNAIGWTTNQLAGTSSYTPASTVLDNQLYLVRSTGSTGMEVLSSSLPPLGEISSNGTIVRMLGDINGDGFADVFSGGSAIGVIIFGKSTKDLLDAASGTDDLIITAQNATIQDLISLGDFNGDGLEDLGILDNSNNFYLVLGNIELGGQKQLTMIPDANSLSQLAGISKAFAIQDYNGDGYDDILLASTSGSNLISLGNQSGKLPNFAQSSNLPSIAVTSATGVDIDGDGNSKLAINLPTATDNNIGGFSLYSYPPSTPTVVELYDFGFADVTADRLNSIGDFNGDGLEDIAILVKSINSSPVISAIYIYYGTPQGLSSRSAPSLVLSTLNWNENYSTPPAQVNEFTNTGDLNGDGYDDLIVGASTTNNNQGATFVVFGGLVGSDIGLGYPFADLTQLEPSQGFTITGLSNSQAGIAVGGGKDINGDGFDDLIIGAPGNNDNLSYVLFGSDFNNTVNQTGTIGDDVMLGTATGESFVAGQGDDQIYTGGGLDVVYAGPGDDWVELKDTYFRRLDGGPGLDVLELHGYNGQAWDLTTLAPGVRLQDFEVIDIRNYGGNTLTLNALTVTNLSSNNTLVILQDEADNLALSTDFQADGTTYQYGEKYYQYTSQSSAAKVLVNQAKPPAHIAPSKNTPATILPSTTANAENTLLESQQTLTNVPNSTVVSDPNAPTQLFISNPIVAEQTGLATFSIQRSGNLNKYSLVSYQTVDEDGKAGGRYLPVAGRLVFAPGETQKSVTVIVPNDGIDTGNRQFGLLVSLSEESLEPPTGPKHLQFQANANGEQMRRWHYEEEPVENSLVGQLTFSTTVANGQAQIDIAADGTGDFNDFFNFNAQTSQYESLLFKNQTGAVFTYANSHLSDTPNGIQLTLQDGGRGDADGVANGLVKTQGYISRTIPGLITENNQTLLAPTTADGQIQFRLIDAPLANYELGWLAVDSTQGQIDGLNPGDSGYLEAARQRLSQPDLRQVLFQDDGSAASQALTSGLAQQSFIDPKALVSSEQQFFGTLANSQLTANQPYVLYALADNQLQLSSLQTPQIVRESRGYQSLFFAGLTAEIGSNALVVPGAWSQTVPLQASLSRAAAYQNLIALYQVDSLTGGLDLDGDTHIDVRPGDSGYTRQALARAQNPLTGVPLNTPDNFNTRQEIINLLGNHIYGMVIIPNATIAEVLTQNPDNLGGEKPLAFFSFGLANPDGLSHMARLGNNLFGFEDQVGGGDFDYNDMILQFQAS
ncbi:SwmB domain-containing protein [Synechocystis sp. LKSZ1]|uniref:SwmB domain-containing protein n=1 Tax=Synechocystis sp. LKSZ1 TaxID=3144951 RepID=UPI00336C13B3